MGVKLFRAALCDAQYGKVDREWFPRWLRCYAASVQAPDEGMLPVTEAQVIRFSRSLLESGTPAWQRLQAVRTVEAYRDLVLKRNEPSLQRIRLTLGRLANREKTLGTADRPGVEDELHLVGRIDPKEPVWIQRIRRELRMRGLALTTERAYTDWTRRFMRHCGSEELQRFGEPAIKSFLTELAVEGEVAASTQNQAKSALLFLYQEVMGRELGFLDGPRATKPKRLPVVLSRDEIARLLPEFEGRSS